MNPIQTQSWFPGQQMTVVGALRAVRDTYRNHSERYTEDTVDDGAGRHCALGMIALYTSGTQYHAGELYDQVCLALRAELPASQEAFVAIPGRRGGTFRGYGGVGGIIASCSNVLGPEFIADACDRAIQKLEYTPESAGVANFVKPKVEVQELVPA